MNRLSKTLAAALALGSAVTMTGTASAHDWNRPGYGYSQPYGGGYGDQRVRQRAAYSRYLVGTTCSGQRGATLEHHLRFQYNLGRVDRWTAGRIQTAIDRLQWREQHECGEGDWRAAGRIGREYQRISRWITDVSGPGGYGDGWRR
jgi:hypothetical protein